MNEKKLLLWIFALLNICDAIFTIHLVSKTGMFFELNPLFAFLLRKDVLLFAATKISFSVAITYCLGKFPKTTRILRVLVTFFAALIFWQIVFTSALK